MNATKSRKPRCTKPIPAPTVKLLSWDWNTGTGRASINEVEYSLTRLADDHGKTVGARLSRPSEDAARVLGCPEKIIDVDFTAPHGWQCDCECAVYDPQRGPCKHVQGLRQLGPQIRETEALAYAELMAPGWHRC